MGEPSDKSSSLPPPVWLQALFAPPSGALAATLPFVLFLVAINSLVEPYIFGHDARLYAIQTIARLEPGPSQDLYLLHGSQDRFTIFSMLVAPLVAVVGLHPAFFLVYLAGKFLFFWSVLRLVGALVDDSAARFLGLVFFALVPVPFGGLDIFQLNECFVTPRPFANALVLFALERALAGRWLAPIFLLAGSFLLHPLMAAPGAAIFLCWTVHRAAGWRGFVVAFTLIAGGGMASLLYPPLGERIFGSMDEEWRRLALQMCYHVDPASWERSDWWRIAWALGVTILTVWHAPPRRAAFLVAVLAVAIAGLLGSVVAPYTHYRLLIQVSPYRAMWVLELLAVPLTVSWVAAWWRHGSEASLSLALAALLLLPADPYYVPLPLVWFGVGFFLPLAVWYRGLCRLPHSPNWLWACTLRAFAGSVALGLIYDGTVTLYYLAIAGFTDQKPGLHPVSVLLSVTRLWYRLPLLLAAAWAGRSMLTQARPALVCGTLLGLCISYQGALFLLPRTDAYTGRFVRSSREVAFVKAFLEREPRLEGNRFTIYWRRDLTDIWFGAGANSYFNGIQMSGASFHRETAQEGLRRLGHVRSFEMEVGRQYQRLPDWEKIYLGLTGRATAVPPPSRADLRQLCRDPLIDFAIMENRFDGLYCATDGTVYIYDCRKLRSHSLP